MIGFGLFIHHFRMIKTCVTQIASGSGSRSERTLP